MLLSLITLDSPPPGKMIGSSIVVRRESRQKWPRTRPSGSTCDCVAVVGSGGRHTNGTGVTNDPLAGTVASVCKSVAVPDTVMLPLAGTPVCPSFQSCGNVRLVEGSA